MPNTSRMGWPYPSENQDPWYDAMVALFSAIDASTYALRENSNLLLSGGGVFNFDSTTGQLDWTDTFSVFASYTGFAWQLAPTTVTIDDGQILYFTATRAPTSNQVVTPVVSGKLPVGDNAIILAIRSGSAVYFRQGLKVLSGVPSGTLTQYLPGGHNEGTTLNEIEVAVGGLWFDPTVYNTPTISFRLIGAFDSPDAGASGQLRLYDMGDGTGPFSEELRSEVSITYADAGETLVVETGLTVSATPGVNTGEIFNSGRVYELRIYVDTAVPSSSMHMSWGGLSVVSVV